jgi:hypothetical protein
MPGRKRLAGALAVAVAAVAISACGSSDDKTIDPADAQGLQSSLDAVQAAINNRDCKRAQAEAQNFVDAVNQLPESVGTDNKETLRSAGERLEELAGDKSQCKPVPVTGASGFSGQQSSTTSTTLAEPPPTTTEATTTSTTTAASAPEPSSNAGGGNEGQGGGPPASTGGPPSGTQPAGGGSGTGGGSSGGGAAGGGGGTGSGGTGAGGTG